VDGAREGPGGEGDGMRVTSTRASAGAPTVSLSQALAAGLAPDGGLFVPERFPTLDPGAMEEARAVVAGGGKEYRPEETAQGDMAGPPGIPGRREATEGLGQVAEILLRPFFRGDALEGDLPALCREAFTFPAPLVPMDDGEAVPPGDPRPPQGAPQPNGAARPTQALLELFHGPTAAFKDYAARFLAAALSRIPGEGERHVLVATSGDTGSAVAAAFHRRPGFRVTVLYPEAGVSPRQAHLLGCFGDNVRAFRVRGSFDDCQRLAKGALSDPELRRRHGLTSANSISLGRLLPQMAYYAHAALEWQVRWGKEAGLPGFIIPSGNFGNALACLWARDLGLPIGEVILATNANRALVDWVETGRADPRPVQRTLANAMDVGIPSNLERLRWQHPEPPPGLSAISLSDHEIREAVAAAPRRWGQVVCPHTACGLHALGRLRDAGDGRGWIPVATAHPAKFPEVVEPLVGQAVPVPPAMQAWLALPARAESLEASPGALARALAQG
jgi:threonine synthase